ncbi:hypothetical protein FRC12_010808, partial [Ceratobasidium sp. 428]
MLRFSLDELALVLTAMSLLLPEHRANPQPKEAPELNPPIFHLSHRLEYSGSTPPCSNFTQNWLEPKPHTCLLATRLVPADCPIGAKCSFSH